MGRHKREKKSAGGRHRRPKTLPAKPDRCMGCDLDHHHPGRKVEGCHCYCGSRI